MRLRESPQVAASQHAQRITACLQVHAPLRRPLPHTQEAIRELHLCTTVDNEELQRLGVKLELDDRTGKLRVTKREDSGVPA